MDMAIAKCCICRVIHTMKMYQYRENKYGKTDLSDDTKWTCYDCSTREFEISIGLRKPEEKRDVLDPDFKRDTITIKRHL